MPFFFLQRKMFLFKGGEEHCGLKISQVKRLENSDCYV